MLSVGRGNDFIPSDITISHYTDILLWCFCMIKRLLCIDDYTADILLWCFCMIMRLLCIDEYTCFT